MVTLRPFYCQAQQDHIKINCSYLILKYYLNIFILIHSIVCCSLLMVKFIFTFIFIFRTSLVTILNMSLFLFFYLFFIFLFFKSLLVRKNDVE